MRISDALKKVCQSAGINIINMELLNDKIYTNGYTCYNKAFQEIKELVSTLSKTYPTLNGNIFGAVTRGLPDWKRGVNNG